MLIFINYRITQQPNVGRIVAIGVEDNPVFLSSTRLTMLENLEHVIAKSICLSVTLVSYT